MTLPRIIGINGLKRSGKDTIGQYLVREHGYERLSFAEPLYEAVWRLNPEMTFWSEWSQFKGIRIQDAVNHYGWEGLKNGEHTPETKAEVRRLLEVMGTEVGRQLFGQNFWVDLAVSKIEDGQRYVFTDMRFENEIQAVADYKPDAYTLKVMRPGCTPNGHASDRDLPNDLFDGSVMNDDTIPALEERVYDMLRVGR
jgi:hypothetical protein